MSNVGPTNLGELNALDIMNADEAQLAQIAKRFTPQHDAANIATTEKMNASQACSNELSDEVQGVMSKKERAEFQKAKL